MSRGAIWPRLAKALTDPTQRQKEAYARFMHTLAAAAVIGAITLLFTEGAISSALVYRMTGLVIGAVVCFAGGVLLLERD